MDRETLIESVVEIASQGQFAKDARSLIEAELVNTKNYGVNEINRITDSLVELSMSVTNRGNAEYLVDILYHEPSVVMEKIVERKDLL